MEKLSRKKLDLALDSLRELRKEEAYSGNFYNYFATCYDPGFQAFYRWVHVPGKYVCPKCGKRFGSDTENGTNAHEICARSNGTIIMSDFDETIEAYKTCIKEGYDVEFELHCCDCVKEYDYHPAVFRFRAFGEKEYTVSYPQIQFNSWSYRKEKRLSEKHFYPWQYTLAVGFLTKAMSDEMSTNTDETCRKWLNSLTKELMHESEAWSVVDESIKGILGLSLERPF